MRKNKSARAHVCVCSCACVCVIITKWCQICSEFSVLIKQKLSPFISVRTVSVHTMYKVLQNETSTR